MTVAVDRVAPALAMNAVSTWNGRLASPALWACVTTGLIPAAVTPPQVCGKLARMLTPSRSFWGTYADVGVPSALTTLLSPLAPGKLPKRLSNALFSA